MDGDVGFSLRSNTNGCESDVNDVEAIPCEALVGADGLQGCYWDSDSDVVELDLSAKDHYNPVGAMLTFAFCWLNPMLAALAMIAGTAKIAANFMMEMKEKCL